MIVIELNSKLSSALVRSTTFLEEAKKYITEGSVLHKNLKKVIQNNEKLIEEFDEWWANEEDDPNDNDSYEESEEEKKPETPPEVQATLDVLIGVMKKQEQHMVQGAASDQIKINAAQLVLDYFCKKEGYC